MQNGGTNKIRDAQLVLKALKNANDFVDIVKNYESPLRRYVTRLGCRDTHDADDLLQDIFIKVYVNLNDYDADLKFSSWLYRIAHNETIRIIGAVFLGSMVLGVTLHSLDIGERVQKFLVESSPYYDALTYTSKDTWSQPEKGLLGGIVTHRMNSKEVELTDFKGEVWRVDIKEIDDENALSLVQEGVMLKIIGRQKDNSLFFAEEVFPWE